MLFRKLKEKKEGRKKPLTRGNRDRGPGEITFNEDTAMPEAVVGHVQEDLETEEFEKDTIIYETLAVPEIVIGTEHKK